MQRFGRAGLGVLVALWAALAGAAVEQAEAQTSTGQAANSGPSTDQVFNEALEKTDEFEAFGWPPKGRFTISPEFTNDYVEFNRRLWNNYGILYVLAPTVMMQKGSQGGGQDFTSNEQYNGLFAWRLLNQTRIGTGYFIFNNLHVSQLTRTSGVDFSKSLGINYFSSDSVGNTETIKALLWRHQLPGDFLTIFVGHDEIANLDGGCRYACDDTTSFISSPLATNIARTLPGQGAAAAADLEVFDGVFVEGIVADARGDGNLNFRRVFNTGEHAYAGSLRFENPFKSHGDGLYKLTYYKVDATRQGTPAAQSATQGLTIQVDQDFGDLGVFAKYSKVFQRKGSIEQYAAGGLVWTKPFGNDEDWLGLGFGWADPTAPGANNEYVAETFYRLQLTPFVQLTPGAMMVINPSNKPDSNIEGVFNLRLRGQF